MNGFTYEFDLLRHRVMVSVTGSPEFEDAEQLINQITTDPLYQPGFDVLVDRRRAPACNSEYIRRIVRLVDSLHSRIGSTRWAVVVSDLESFGMGRMAGLLTEYPESIRPFKRMSEAEQWLDDTPSEGTGFSYRPERLLYA